jgi:hypothetical protein
MTHDFLRRPFPRGRGSLAPFRAGRQGEPDVFFKIADGIRRRCGHDIELSNDLFCPPFGMLKPRGQQTRRTKIPRQRHRGELTLTTTHHCRAMRDGIRRVSAICDTLSLS